MVVGGAQATDHPHPERPARQSRQEGGAQATSPGFAPPPPFPISSPRSLEPCICALSRMTEKLLRAVCSLVVDPAAARIQAVYRGRMARRHIAHLHANARKLTALYLYTRYTLHIAHYTLHIAHHTLHIAHYTLHNYRSCMVWSAASLYLY